MQDFDQCWDGMWDDALGYDDVLCFMMVNWASCCTNYFSTRINWKMANKINESVIVQRRSLLEQVIHTGILHIRTHLQRFKSRGLQQRPSK